MSSASRPAVAMARFAAMAPIVAVVSCGPATRRSRMPVRVRIHSSDVSTMRSRSALVRTPSGAYMPQPVIRALRGCIVPTSLVPVLTRSARLR